MNIYFGDFNVSDMSASLHITIEDLEYELLRRRIRRRRALILASSASRQARIIMRVLNGIAPPERTPADFSSSEELGSDDLASPLNS